MTAGNEKIMNARSLFREIRKKLEEGGIENACGEAGFIIEYLTGRSYPSAMLDDSLLSKKITDSAADICKRRTSGEPLQYIFGQWDFYGMTFKVGKGVLIPRADTELLVEEAIRLRDGFDNTNYVDLCSGSGCVAAAVAKYVKGVHGAAIEKSPEAFRYLKENLSRLASEIEPCCIDALLAETAKKYTELDLITANPPYLTADDMNSLQREVTFEPSSALFGGDDGLMFYRELTHIWKGSLKSGGILLFEVGMGQHEAVMEILRENDFCSISCKCDLAGIERAVMGKRI